MEQSDVLIVGGGPAGSSLAQRLIKYGIDTVVIDRLVFPRDKVCAGWVTPPILSSLQIDTTDYSKQRVLQPIHGFRIGIIGSSHIETHDRNSVISYGIRRCEFDNYLLQRSGARLKLGLSLNKINRSGTKWVINDTYTTPLIVGAGGHYCPVARYMNGNAARHGPIVVAQEIEFRMTAEQSGQCAISPELPELYFCGDYKGYGWVFRKENYLNIGLGREDKDNLSEHVKSFCEFLVQAKKIPADIPRNFHGHAYLLYQHGRPRITADGMLLAGDAAGLAFTHSGEGIRPAVESGLLAAEAIRKAQGDYSNKNLASYQRSLTERFGVRKTPLNLMQLLPDYIRQFVARRCIANQWFAGKVIIDDWFLHSRQHPLLIG